MVCAMACIWRSEVNLEELALLQCGSQGWSRVHQAWQGQVPLPVSHLSDWGIFILFYFYGFWARTDLKLTSLCLPPKCWDHKHMLSHLLRIWFWIFPSPVTSLRSHSDDTGKVCYVIKFLTAQSPGSHALFSDRMNHAVMMISFLLNCFSFSKQYKMKRRGKSYFALVCALGGILLWSPVYP